MYVCMYTLPVHDFYHPPVGVSPIFKAVPLIPACDHPRTHVVAIASRPFTLVAEAFYYEGERSGGVCHGLGTMFHSDGGVVTDRYERHGFKDGTYTYPDGRVVKVVNGKGIYIYIYIYGKFTK